MNEINQETSGSNWDSWKLRLRKILRWAAPFVSGVAAVLVALWLYNILFPPPEPMTTRDVDEAVAQALASATPAAGLLDPGLPGHPTFAGADPDLGQRGQMAKKRTGLGSGVVINERGDILTSLHVVEDADEIQLTFADGTQSSAQVVLSQPENDIAVLQADQLPALLVPAMLGNPEAMRVGDEALCRRQSLWPVQLDERRRHLRFRPLFQPAGQRSGAGRLDPDRCGGEPRQFGRSAAQPRRPGDRHRRRALSIRPSRISLSALALPCRSMSPAAAAGLPPY